MECTFVTWVTILSSLSQSQVLSPSHEDVCSSSNPPHTPTVILETLAGNEYGGLAGHHQIKNLQIVTGPAQPVWLVQFLLDQYFEKSRCVQIVKPGATNNKQG